MANTTNSSAYKHGRKLVFTSIAFCLGLYMSFRSTLNESTLCKDFTSSLPTDWQHDFIEVPENWNDAKSTKIKIFYYWRGKTSDVTPVINGGPNASSHSLFESIKEHKNLNKFFSESPILLFDQRGTGCSTNYPESIQKLPYYASDSIVKDLEAIRKHLNIKKWNIFGQSYGGYVVYRYLLLAPQSLNNIYVYAESLNDDLYRATLNRIKSQVRVIESYLVEYPEDKNTLIYLAETLSSDVCFSDLAGYDICGHQVLYYLLKNIGFTEYWEHIHTDLQKLANLSAQELVAELGSTLKAIFKSEKQSKYYYEASVVLEKIDSNFEKYSAKTCRKISEDLELESTNEFLKFTDCGVYLQENHPVQLYEAEPDLSALVKKTEKKLITSQMIESALLNNPKVQVWVHSAGKDSYVPKENFDAIKNLASKLPNLHYEHHEESGHGGFLD